MLETLQRPTTPDASEFQSQQQYAEAIDPRRAENIGAQVGGLMLQNEVAISDEYIQQGLDALAEEANAAATPDARVHDVDAAHAAALEQNEIFDAHVAAIQENQVLDAHVEALAENKMFNLYAEALQEDKVRAEAAPQPPVPDHKEEDVAPPTVEDATVPDAADYKGQAEVALTTAGVKEELPVGSQVTKDQVTGNLVITNNHTSNVRIIEQHPGATPRVVDYKFNKDKGILTIRANGADTILTRQGEYTENTPEASREATDSVVLPPAVARAVGFRTAVPVL